MTRWILFLAFSFSLSASAQSLIFCESVTKGGKPVHPSTVFAVNKAGGFCDLLVLMPHAVNTKEVKYDIYKLDSGKETFEATYKQTISEASTWFEKEITFIKAGEYNVYVYTAEDKLLCVSKVKIVIKEK